MHYALVCLWLQISSASATLNGDLLKQSTVGNAEEVDRLLLSGANADFMSKKDGQTPLIGAAMNGHIRIVERLLKAGVDCNAQNEVDLQSPHHTTHHTPHTTHTLKTTEVVVGCCTSNDQPFCRWSKPIREGMIYFC
jgi:ankyrin repeat protein